MPRHSIQLHNGPFVDLLDPSSSTWTVTGIASPLSKLCRWTGNCEPFYSVAQHCVHMSYLCEPDLAKVALMHEVDEVATGDVPGPVKRLVPELRVIAKRVQTHVFAKFGLPVSWLSAIKSLDTALQHAEKRDIMPEHPDDALEYEGYDPHPLRILPVERNEAKAMFLARWAELNPDGLFLGGPLCRTLLDRTRIPLGYRRIDYVDSDGRNRWCFAHVSVAGPGTELRRMFAEMVTARGRW